MDNKKNTVLLTVIAVATLLVAVVGATFAYFTAQGGTGTTANVTVSTGTAASSEFGSFGAINIYADATTFAQGAGDKSGNTTGTVSWTAPGATTGSTPSEADRTFCYTAKLDITTNTFVYSTDNTAHAAELEFSASKTPAGGAATIIIDKMDITTKTAEQDIDIPTASGGSTYKHTLVAEAGSTVSDSWTLTVTLKNLNVDQNENTGKSFTGVIKFDKVSCS